jgi:hypothetical protein
VDVRAARISVADASRFSAAYLVSRARRKKADRLDRLAEKHLLTVIPNGVRNPSVLQIQERRDSSAKRLPRNDGDLSFSAGCKACVSLNL